MSQSGMLNVSASVLPPEVPLQFTTDAGIAVPAANNLNVLGANGLTTQGAGSTITITNASDLHVARFIVASSTSGTGANFTTIASAITAAVATAVNSTIFIQPGTYTENLTLPANINLCAFECDALTPNVTIVGTITKTTAGSSSISGIRIQTNSLPFLSVTGSAASIVNLNNCYLNCTNNTGITFSSSSASASINITNCSGNLGTTGIGLFTHTSSGALNINYSMFTNFGSSLTASTCSSGVLNITYSNFVNAITTSSSSAVTWDYITIDVSSLNITAATLGGSGTHVLRHSRFSSGTASAISIGSATPVLEYCTIVSSNTNCITGSGTLTGNTLLFEGASSGVNTTTKIPLTFGIQATWTPNLQINSSNTGITYSTQTGGYVIIGNIVSIWGMIFLSSKGASVGNVTISNLPIPISANGTLKIIPVGEFDQVTKAGYTNLGLRLNDSAIANFTISSASGSAVAFLTNAEISNTFQCRFSGIYIIN